MSWATEDLREGILGLFVEVQEPWQSRLIDEIIRLIGCQRLRDTVAKLNWAAKNKDKQRRYNEAYYEKHKDRVLARCAARRATPEAREKHREAQARYQRRKRENR